MDSDIIVNLDIDELWRIDLADNPLAGVPEMQSYVPTNPIHYICREGFVKAEDHFNAGMVVMNLNRLRLEGSAFKKALEFYAEHPECDGADQTILNYCFSEQTVKLPQKFNLLVEFARMNNDFETTDRICHYITSSRGRGYGLDMRDSFNRLWLKYFVKTPWFDCQTFGRLCKSVQDLRNGLKGALLNLSFAMSGKTRVFFILQNYLDFVVENFSVKDDEEIIIISYDSPMEKLIGIMNESRGKKVFFIMAPDFPFDVLMQAGFVANGDFFDCFEFLSDAQGLPLDSYPLIWAL